MNLAGSYKLFLVAAAAAAGANGNVFDRKSSDGKNGSSNNNGNPTGNGGKDNGVDGGSDDGPVECVLHRLEPYMIDGAAEGEEAKAVCVMSPEFEDGVEGVAYDVDEATFPYNFFDDVEYAETVISISSTTRKNLKPKHGGGIIQVRKGATIKKEKKPEKSNNRNGIRSSKNLRGSNGGDGNSGNSNQRRLSPKTGDVTLIVLYAIPPDAHNDILSTALADDVFGVDGDPINARSQILACSKNQLNYIHACSAGSFCEGDEDIINGVLEVPITQNVTGVASGTVVNWVNAAAQEILISKHIYLHDNFTKIMYVIPDEASWGGAAAWAYVPGTTSAFRDSYSFRMGVQVHELGHNWGMGHSGFDGKGYADYSCLMGSPSYGDDGPEICFNGAKSWLTTWYAQDSVSVDPAVGFSGELVGVADWVEDRFNPGQHNVVLQIIDTSISENFYVIFNRKKGPNQGVTFHADEVTITLSADSGTSWHQAAIGNPNTDENYFPIFRKKNYNDGPKDLVIKSCGITLGNETTPGVASVKVYLDDGPGYNNGPMCPGEVPCIDDTQCEDENFCTSTSCDLSTNTCKVDDISGIQCPSCGERTYCNPAGYCDPVCYDFNPCSNDWCNVDSCQNDPIPGCMDPGVYLDSWYNIAGSLVSDLTNNVKYQSNTPDETQVIDNFDAPRNRANSFGARLSAYLVSPLTGDFTFYIASDDSSNLFLSADDDSGNKALIASLSGWTNPEQWTAKTSQKSVPISLIRGSVYYIEALYKDGGGGDHLSVAWESPDNSIPLAIIGKEHFFKHPPVPCTEDSQCIDNDPCTNPQCNLESSLCEFATITDCGDIAHRSDSLAFMSTVWDGGSAEKANDGNYNTDWSGGSIAQTCVEDNAWWELSFGALENVINRITIFNRGDCCWGHLSDSEVQILDIYENVVESRMIGLVDNSGPLIFDFDKAVGRSIRIRKSTYGMLNLAEVDVFGWTLPNVTAAPSVSSPPSSSPTSFPSQAPSLVASASPSGSPTAVLSQSPSVSSQPTYGGNSDDIGPVGLAGSAMQFITGGHLSWVVEGSGSDIWSFNDQFHFVSFEYSYANTDIDASIQVVDFDGGSINYWAKSGLMLRDSLAPNSANYLVYLAGGKEVVSQARLAAGWQTPSGYRSPGLGTTSVKLRIKKVGNNISTFYRVESSPDWIQVGPTRTANFVNPLGKFYLGIAVTSHDNSRIATLTARDLDIQLTSANNTVLNIAHVGGAVATQSSLCWGGPPERAIDGNYNTWMSGNSISHTCDEDNAWWEVALGAAENIITRVVVYNREDSCCWNRLSGSQLEILDNQGSVVESRFVGTLSNGKPQSFDFDNIVGKVLRIKKTTYGNLNLAEVDVFGWPVQ